MTDRAAAVDVRHLDVPAADGRKLRVHDDGEPGDRRPALLMHHGTPGSGLLLDAQLTDARARGIRLVGYDRPGYGGSDRHPGRRVADAAADGSAIADALELDRFLTAGASGGGPHALACAALLPDRVAAVASVAGVAPCDAAGLDWSAGMGEENIEEFAAAAAGEAALAPFVVQGREAVLGSTARNLADSMQSLLPPADLRALDAGLAGWLHANMVAALTPGHEGWLDDDLAFVRDWGFALSDVQRPVLVMAGGQDLMVPVAHGQWLAGQLSDVTADIDPEAGHLSLLAGVDRMHQWLLAHW